MNSSSISRPDARDAKSQLHAEWLPIETAPRDGRDILLWGVHSLDGQRQFVGGWWPAAEDWASEDGEVIRFDATHWMPLPEPPRDQQSERDKSRETP